MNFSNRLNLPDPVVKALSSDDYDSGAVNSSVTTLIDAPQIKMLTRKHQDEIEGDVSDRLWSVLGTAVHNMFENHASGDYLSEERLFAEIKGWSIIFGKDSWAQQLNFYAWLVRQCKDVTVNKLQIVAVLRDWKQSEAQFKPDYPQAGIVIVDVPLWSTSQQDDFVAGRVELHQQAERDYINGDPIAFCTADERWARKPKYAVMKKGRKKAVKLHTDEVEALSHCERLGAGHSVDHRKGESVRCERYCEVSKFCQQHKEEAEND